MKKVITNQYGPNTTVLLPGSCNAKCNFCFWNRDEAKIRVPRETYLEKLFATLYGMPELFSVLSISGGEPTLSPYFSSFLVKLSRFRRTRNYERVVLTTNGVLLDKHLVAIGCAVDHINISRHAISDEDNIRIFKTETIPTNDELKRTISRIHKVTSCDVTLNCVIPETDVNNGLDTFKFCNAFIEYAKSLGADAVSFRKVASTVAPTMAEKMFAKKYGVSNETQCPVCRGMNQRVEGYDVRWKGTVNEPSLDTNGIYEIVIHPDAKMYVDWGMAMPVSLETLVDATAKFETRSQSAELVSNPILRDSKSIKKVRSAGHRFTDSYSSGCGSGGCGSSGFSSGGCGSGGCGH